MGGQKPVLFCFGFLPYDLDHDMLRVLIKILILAKGTIDYCTRANKIAMCIRKIKTSVSNCKI